MLLKESRGEIVRFFNGRETWNTSNWTQFGECKRCITDHDWTQRSLQRHWKT